MTAATASSAKQTVSRIELETRPENAGSNNRAGKLTIPVIAIAFATPVLSKPRVSNCAIMWNENPLNATVATKKSSVNVQNARSPWRRPSRVSETSRRSDWRPCLARGGSLMIAGTMSPTVRSMAANTTTPSRQPAASTSQRVSGV